MLCGEHHALCTLPAPRVLPQGVCRAALGTTARPGPDPSRGCTHPAVAPTADSSAALRRRQLPRVGMFLAPAANPRSPPLPGHSGTARGWAEELLWSLCKARIRSPFSLTTLAANRTQLSCGSSSTPGTSEQQKGLSLGPRASLTGDRLETSQLCRPLAQRHFENSKGTRSQTSAPPHRGSRLLFIQSLLHSHSFFYKPRYRKEVQTEHAPSGNPTESRRRQRELPCFPTSGQKPRAVFLCSLP